MLLKNTTDFPDYFLRRMVSWCCRELGLPVRCVNKATFRNRLDGRTSGRAWWPSNRICVSVAGTLEQWKAKGKSWGWWGVEDAERQNRLRIDGMVYVTAHELAHLWLHREEHKRTAQERKTDWHAKRIKEKFLAARESLLAEWSAAPADRPQKAKPSLQEQRGSAACKKLAEWQRKLKLAQTKVKSYKRKVRYYDKALATKRREE